MRTKMARNYEKIKTNLITPDPSRATSPITPDDVKQAQLLMSLRNVE